MSPEALPLTTISEPEPDFRTPLPVTEIVYFTRLRTSYPRCPRCRNTLDREYMAFCDRCGQQLDWKLLNRAIVNLVY